MTVSAVTGDLKAVDLVRDVNVKVVAPLTLTSLSADGEYELSSAGVTDHGALTGLGDDDHIQYPLAPVALTDNAIIRGDGGGRGIQDSGILLDDNNNMLLPLGKELRFFDGNASLRAAAPGQINYNGSLAHNFTIGTVGKFLITTSLVSSTVDIQANAFTSTVASGAAPLIVASVDKVVDFNADFLDGLHVGTSGAALADMSVANTWSAAQTFATDKKQQFRDSANYINSPAPNFVLLNAGTTLILSTAGAPRLTIDSTSVRAVFHLSAVTLGSTVASPVPPLSVLSNILVTNLNANFLQGHTATGLLIEDGVDDTPTTLTLSTDPVMALVLSTTTGVASVFFEAFGYLIGAANNDAEWTIAVEDPDGVVLKTIPVKADATGAGDTFKIPFYIQGYDTGPNTGVAGYHLDVDEVSGTASLEVLQTKLTRVAS